MSLPKWGNSEAHQDGSGAVAFPIALRASAGSDGRTRIHKERSGISTTSQGTRWRSSNALLEQGICNSEIMVAELGEAEVGTEGAFEF